MSEIVYDGIAVDAAVECINGKKSLLTSLSEDIAAASRNLNGLNGMKKFGGAPESTFTSFIDSCSEACNNMTDRIRRVQMSIMKYDEGKDYLGSFMESMTAEEWERLGLTEYSQSPEDFANFLASSGLTTASALEALGVEDDTPWWKVAGQTAGIFTLGFFEGLGDFVETGVDTVAIGFGTVGAGISYLFGGKESFDAVMSETRAFVEKQHVSGWVDDWVETSDHAEWIREYKELHPSLYSGTRAIGKGMGYSTAIIATGKLSALGKAATAKTAATTMVRTASVLGFSNATEEAWAGGASTTSGLIQGAVTGAWEGAQWGLGLKVNAATDAMKNAARLAGKSMLAPTLRSTAINMGVDGATGFFEGFVRPGIDAVGDVVTAANNGTDLAFSDAFAQSFEDAGGWENVRTQATIGAGMSGIAEIGGAGVDAFASSRAGQALKSVFSGGNAPAAAGAGLQQAADVGLQQAPVPDARVQQQAPAADARVQQQAPAPDARVQQQAPVADARVQQQAPAADARVQQQAPAADARVQQQAPVADARVQQQAPVADARVQQQAPVADARVQQQAPVADARVQQQAPVADARVQQQAPVADARVQQQAPVADARVQQQAPVPDARVQQQAPAADARVQQQAPAMENLAGNAGNLAESMGLGDGLNLENLAEAAPALTTVASATSAMTPPKGLDMSLNGSGITPDPKVTPAAEAFAAPKPAADASIRSNSGGGDATSVRQNTEFTDGTKIDEYKHDGILERKTTKDGITYDETFKPDGSKDVDIKYNDGSQKTIEIDKNGNVTEFSRSKDGDVEVLVENKNSNPTTTVKTENGTIKTTTTADGDTVEITTRGGREQTIRTTEDGTTIDTIKNPDGSVIETISKDVEITSTTITKGDLEIVEKPTPEGGKNVEVSRNGEAIESLEFDADGNKIADYAVDKNGDLVDIMANKDGAVEIPETPEVVKDITPPGMENRGYQTTTVGEGPNGEIITTTMEGAGTPEGVGTRTIEYQDGGKKYETLDGNGNVVDTKYEPPARNQVLPESPYDTAMSGINTTPPQDIVMKPLEKHPAATSITANMEAPATHNPMMQGPGNIASPGAPTIQAAQPVAPAAQPAAPAAQPAAPAAQPAAPAAQPAAPAAQPAAPAAQPATAVQAAQPGPATQAASGGKKVIHTDGYGRQSYETRNYTDSATGNNIREIEGINGDLSRIETKITQAGQPAQNGNPAVPEIKEVTVSRIDENGNVISTGQPRTVETRVDPQNNTTVEITRPRTADEPTITRTTKTDANGNPIEVTTVRDYGNGKTSTRTETITRTTENGTTTTVRDVTTTDVNGNTGKNRFTETETTTGGKTTRDMDFEHVSDNKTVTSETRYENNSQDRALEQITNRDIETRAQGTDKNGNPATNRKGDPVYEDTRKTVEYKDINGDAGKVTAEYGNNPGEVRVSVDRLGADGKIVDVGSAQHYRLRDLPGTVFGEGSPKGLKGKIGALGSALAERNIVRGDTKAYLKNNVDPDAKFYNKYADTGRNGMIDARAREIALREGKLPSDVRTQAEAEVDSILNRFRHNAEGKQYRRDEGIAEGLENMIVDPPSAKDIKIAAWKEAGRMAAIPAAVVAANALFGGDPTPTISSTVTIEPTVEPTQKPTTWTPSGPSNDDTPSTEDPTITDTEEVTTTEPEEPTITDSPIDEEIIVDTINPDGGNGGGGQSWAPTGDGESFTEEGIITDEDSLLEDEDLEGLEGLDEEEVYTIPMTVDGTKTKVTKDGINPIPILAGLGLAAAAGVGAKIYLDNKKNNENEDEEDEFMDDSEFDNEFGSSDSDLIADEWTEGSEIAEPQDEGLDYERPSFYSDTLGEEI